MGLSLSSHDFTRFEGASRALLSPLAYPSVDVWRGEVLRTVRELLGADVGLFMLSSAPVVHFSESMDEAALAGYNRPLEGADGEGVRLSDPVIRRWLSERRRTRQEVFHNAAVDALLAPYGMRLADSSLHSEGMERARMRDQSSLFSSFRGGEAMVQCGYARPGQGMLGETALPLLQLLLPSFQAGLDALARLGEQRAAFDALDEAVAAFGPDGTELHRNPALVALLAESPGAEAVELALTRLARSVRLMAFRTYREPRPDPPLPSVEVRTPAGRFALRAALLGPGVFGGGGSVLVSVTRSGGPVLPGAASVRARFGLTKREAEVALLAAEGLSNDAIAERLYVSPHTVRHHVESVLAKMAIPSRSALALHLLAAP
jgi:DNA-binding CsgD family transcriptional regulator